MKLVKLIEHSIRYYSWLFKIALRLWLVVCGGLLVYIVITSTWELDWLGDGLNLMSHLYSEEVPTPETKAPAHVSDIAISEILPNCGIKQECPEDTFAVHVYTGQDKDDEPKLCVGGRYVQGVGRGLNIAVIESKRLQLMSLQNFDLYSHNSSTLEAWLENDLVDDDIIIAFTFDEASKELSKHAKAILYKLGSGKIQDLQYRCQWYMISQKGIKGFTPLEDITYAKNNHWGEVIDKRLCVPRRIHPTMISPDPFPRKNPEREKLCRVATELMCEDFCNGLSRHEVIAPSILTNRSLVGNQVLSAPIVVIAGTSLATLALTLETLVYQPGVHVSTVFVVYTSNQVHVPSLAKVFGFQSLLFNISAPLTVNDKIEFGLTYISINYPKKKFAIVIEEGLLLSPDFLFYLAQVGTLLLKDDSLLGVTAWNPYGYEKVSGDPYQSYRVDNFPGLGFLLPMRIFNEDMHGKMHLCCSKKSYKGWKISTKGHMIMPDVSRVLKRPKDIYDEPQDSDSALFTKPRLTNTNQDVWVERPLDLLKDNYTRVMERLVDSSIKVYLDRTHLVHCSQDNDSDISLIMHLHKGEVFAFFYQEETESSVSILRLALKCIGIFLPESHQPHNTYENIIRLTYNGNTVLFVESSSVFAKNYTKFQ